MNTSIIITLDTITNLIMLLSVILPVYILGLSHIIGDMPIIRCPILKRSVNGRMQIYTLRNPWSGKWITTISLSYRPIPLQPIASPIAAFSNPYRFAMGLLVIFLLSACDGPTSNYSDNTVGWYSDYSITDIQGDGKVFYAGTDTLLYVTDPVITYYSDKPIKDVLVSVLDNTGKRHAIESYYEDRGYRVRIFNDQVYAIQNGVSVRFDVMAYDDESDNGPIKTYDPNGVCIEAFPVLPDMVVSGLTKGYDYKVSNLENRTNRCFVNPDQDGVVCHSKNRGDTLYFIDEYCPATLRAKAEMGG